MQVELITPGQFDAVLQLGYFLALAWLAGKAMESLAMIITRRKP